MYSSYRRPTTASIIGLSLMSYILLGLLYWLPFDWLRDLIYSYLGWSTSQSIELDWSRMSEYLLVVPILTWISSKMSDHFVLHDKYEQRLGVLVHSVVLYTCLYRLPEYSWVVNIGSLGFIYLLLSSYQRERSSTALALGGLLVGGLALVQPQAYLLLPLSLVMLYPLRCLSLRNALALVHGALLAPFFAIPIYYFIDPQGFALYIQGWLAEWYIWLTTLPSLIDYPPLFLHLPWLLLLAIIGLIGHISHAQRESIRQRDMEVALLWLSFGGLLLTGVTADTGGLLPTIICFPISVLVVRALDQMRGKLFILVGYAFVALALLIALLH